MIVYNILGIQLKYFIMRKQKIPIIHCNSFIQSQHVRGPLITLFTVTIYHILWEYINAYIH